MTEVRGTGAIAIATTFLFCVRRVMMMADDESLRSSSSDSNSCPICLAQITDDSYLDQCFHKFCYSCILRWTNVVASKQSCGTSSLKCPLCKTDNLSIIYGYDGNSFERHYVGKSLVNSDFFSAAHRYRLQCYYTDPDDLSDKLHVARFWKLRKYLQPNRFLTDWLHRELQAVMQEEDVNIVMHHALGVIDSLRRRWQTNPRPSTEIVREEFRASISEAIRPFLIGRTDRFVNGIELFLGSGLNVGAYDKACTKLLGWRIPEISENDWVDLDEPCEHTSAVPYLYIFNEDVDET